MRFTAVLLLAACAAVGAQEAPAIPAPGNGVSAPVAVMTVKPDYTEAAMAAGLQGAVRLETVVLADGTVGDVRIVQSLDPSPGLDQQAVNAMKQWVFKPGERDGKPVAVRVQVEMTFSLR